MNIQKLMRQAQEAQAKMTQMQDQLADEVVSASAGGGMVKVEMSGDQKLISVKLDPSAVDPEEIEMLEDMIVAAVNEASRTAGELASTKMQEITGGLNIPGLM